MKKPGVGLFSIVLNNLETGIALCDLRLQLLLFNGYFVRTCEEFLKRRIRLKRALPGRIKKYLKGIIKGTMRGKIVKAVTSPYGEEFFFTVKQVSYGKRSFLLITFHKKVLREQELFKFLRREYRITEREFEIINYIKKGLHNREIAELLKVSENTVRSHLRRVFKKVDVSNRTELIGLIEEMPP